MTREGIACDKFEMLMVEGKKEAEQWKIVMEQEGHAKVTANEKLMDEEVDVPSCTWSGKLK